MVSGTPKKIVSDPITQLSKIAEAVAENKDFSLRADEGRADEVGKLMTSFNQMLGNIQTRDTELEVARKQTEEMNRTLEEKVEKRTSELARFLSSRVMMARRITRLR